MGAREDFDTKFAKFTREIMEHDSGYVSIRVLVTYSEGAHSKSWNNGTGCYYSFLGACKELLVVNDERTRQHVREESDGLRGG